jgi:hypothetical protein
MPAIRSSIALGTAFAKTRRMARPAFIVFIAFAIAACVGDSNPANDAGNDSSVTDAAPPDVAVEAAPGTCVFGTSHFDDGCKFGP